MPLTWRRIDFVSSRNVCKDPKQSGIKMSKYSKPWKRKRVHINSVFPAIILCTCGLQNSSSQLKIQPESSAKLATDTLASNDVNSESMMCWNCMLTDTTLWWYKPPLTYVWRQNKRVNLWIRKERTSYSPLETWAHQTLGCRQPVDCSDAPWQCAHSSCNNAAVCCGWHIIMLQCYEYYIV